MSEEIVPLISSSVAGPLGIRQLPRLWLKILLSAGVVAYIENEKPGYLQLEAWVKEHARNLTPESVAALNHTILTRDMSAEMAGERRERFGIADPAFAHAVSLNDLRRLGPGTPPAHELSGSVSRCSRS